MKKFNINIRVLTFVVFLLVLSSFISLSKVKAEGGTSTNTSSNEAVDDTATYVVHASGDQVCSDQDQTCHSTEPMINGHDLNQKDNNIGVENDTPVLFEEDDEEDDEDGEEEEEYDDDDLYDDDDEEEDDDDDEEAEIDRLLRQQANEYNELCKNEHKRCDEWANIGECDKNPNYMLKKCQRSCHQCEL